MSAEPRLIDGMSPVDYHGHHDYLSVSGAKKLLPPSCPAKFKASLGREEFSNTFDFGKAAHARVLGEGEEIVVIDAEDWRGKAAREARDEARAAGAVPILTAENEVIEAMAASLKAHEIAPLLFAQGKAEQSAFWTDPATGVKCRARFDWLPDSQDGKRLIIPDLKTAASADPGEFSRAAARYHYAMQDDWYCDAAKALGLDDDPAFLFVVIEKEFPYLVTVGQLSEDDKRLGRAMNDKARRIYAECVATDTWPGYHPGIASFELPNYYHFAYQEIAS